MEISGPIMVGKTIQKSLPVWGGIKETKYRPAMENTGLGSTGAAIYLFLQPSDGDRVFALWKADSSGHFDNEPPLTFVAGEWGQITLYLNAANGCTPANLAVAAGEKTLSLRLRAVDAAGNMSKPRDVKIAPTPDP
jgi:hypothetical protein